MADNRSNDIHKRLADLLRNSYQELHTHPDVGHIAGIGMKHPEKLTMEQIKSLCGEVDRHIRRMKGEG